MKTFFKAEKNINQLEFGVDREFNHARGESIYKALLRKELIDSYQISIEFKGNRPGPIDSLKLSNQAVLGWDDYWVDDRSGLMVDPLIADVNLQRNSLIYVNMSLPRAALTRLNLEGNKNLTHLYIHHAPKLQHLDLSSCTSLSYVCLGENRSITHLSINGCGLPPGVVEQVLRDFRPTITSSANDRGVGMFRKTFNTLLDLRGNEIDWSNRRISSKVRMLLCNNWVVKWDQNPPSEIIPPALYAFYVESTIAK